MAKATVKMPDEFLRQISELGDRTDVIVPAILQAGAEVLEKKVKSNLQAVIGKGLKADRRSTGELVSALGVTAARLDRDGNYNVKIGFSEPRSGGESNAMIANVLEYGKSGQAAKPFLAPAQKASKQACIAAMRAKLEELIKK